MIASVDTSTRLVFAGLFFTYVVATYFRFLRFDIALIIIAISLALLGIALMARKGYIGAGALTPAIFAFLVGLIQYPPTGIARVIAPFILSLWFPGIALLVLGLVYWFLSIRKA